MDEPKRQPLNRLEWLVIAGAALTTVVPVRGQLIASNLDQPNDGGAGVAGPGAIGGWAFRSNNEPSLCSTLKLKCSGIGRSLP